MSMTFPSAPRVDRRSAALGWALLIAVGFWSSPAPGAIEFERVTSTPLATVGAEVFYGAWGDYDGDGRPDLALATLANGARLIRNTPTGFVTATNALPGAAALNAASVAWADYDNDGDPDLFVGTINGQNDALFRNNGDGTFTAAAGDPVVTSGGIGISASWIDVNRDGWLDLLVVNGGGAAEENRFLFVGSATGGFTRVTTGPLVTQPAWGIAAAWADYDEDGDPDVVITQSWDQPNALYANEGKGTFVRTSHTGIGVAAPRGGYSAAWADYDNDGDLDLLITDGANGPSGLYRNDGGGKLTPVLDAAPVMVRGNFSGAAWVDFDNDGWLDLLMSNRTAPPTLFLNRGDGTFEPLQTTAGGSLTSQTEGSNGIATADYDGDGAVDVLLGSWGNPYPTLHRNVGSTNHWLRVRLEGIASNRQGIGARVRVETTIRGSLVRQLRQIGGEDNSGRQEPIAHFGMGDATQANLVRIEWPAGGTTVLTNVPVNQLLTVAEETTPELRILPPGGSFTNSVRVTLFFSAPGAAIHYTTNGTEPTVGTPRYGQPLEFTTRTVLKARAFLNGFPVSDIETAEFVPDPGVRIEPPGGLFTNQVDVVLTTRLAGTTLRYTTDGTDPVSTSAAYQAPLRLTAQTLVKTRAFLNNFPVSEVIAAEFSRVYAFGSDGIPAAWREQYFGGGFATDPRAAADADPDGDGSRNLQEFLGQTHPLDPLSGFMVGIRAVPEVRFGSVPGKRYRIVRRDEVTGVSTVVAESLTATGTETTFVDTSVAAPAAFYLVEVLP